AGADAVVHLAWIFQPTHDPIATWRNNVIGTKRLLEAVVDAGVGALVVASSVGAYSPGPSDDGPVDESWPTDSWPTAAYGREKAYVERLLDAFELRHPDVRVVRLRPGFIFKRSSAEQQRRLFAGPFVPGAVLRPALVPVIPNLPGFRFQALHSDDAAEAYRLAVMRDVRGAFNVAANDLVDAPLLADLFDARVVPVPRAVARRTLAALWQLHVLPASPHLLDLALRLPLMDVRRAHSELGWQATRTARQALAENLAGMREGAGGETPPLAREAAGVGRAEELRTGVGEKGGVTADRR
ncbi:MAG TPA: NAD-dependent epimerase/dehydratase family protein, partial [Acidimicrobiia bacterium]|nr:NAD-dependent epimerase/dehydratase family protein [Acidimicrobiia bacterium]